MYSTGEIILIIGGAAVAAVLLIYILKQVDIFFDKRTKKQKDLKNAAVIRRMAAKKNYEELKELSRELQIEAAEFVEAVKKKE